MTDAAEIKPMLRVATVAATLDVSPYTIMQAIRSGALYGRRIGRHWHVRVEDVNRWLDHLPGNAVQDQRKLDLRARAARSAAAETLRQGLSPRRADSARSG